MKVHFSPGASLPPEPGSSQTTGKAFVEEIQDLDIPNRPVQDYLDRIPVKVLAKSDRALKVTYSMRIPIPTQEKIPGLLDAPTVSVLKHKVESRGLDVIFTNTQWRVGSLGRSEGGYNLTLRSEHEPIEKTSADLGTSTVEDQGQFQELSTSQAPNRGLADFHPTLGLHQNLYRSLAALSNSVFSDLQLFPLLLEAYQFSDAHSDCGRLKNIQIVTKRVGGTRGRTAITDESLSGDSWSLRVRMNRSDYKQITRGEDIGNIPHDRHRAYVALGSNVGDCIKNVEIACREMAKQDIRTIKTSALYQTQPMYFEDQQPFINGVCEVSPRKHQGQSLRG